MKILSFKNCFFSLFNITCLAIIALVVLILMLFGKYISRSRMSDDSSGVRQNEEINDTPNKMSHLQPRNKEILLKIAVFSDSESEIDILNKAMDTASDLEVDFALHLGDLTHLGVKDDFRAVKSIFDKSGIQVYVVPGDRDLWKSNGIVAFNEFFGESYRLLNKKGVAMMLIDNSDEYHGIDQKQWDFIDANLDKVDFVFLHNPIFFSDSYLLGKKGMGQYSEKVDKQRLSLLKKIRSSKNIKAVFAGDQHFFSEVIDDRVPDLSHYVVGALSKERNLQSPRFIMLTVYGNKDYYVKQVVL